MVNQELFSQTFEAANIDGVNDALSDENGPLHRMPLSRTPMKRVSSDCSIEEIH
jgi:hypothetical protein